MKEIQLSEIDKELTYLSSKITKLNDIREEERKLSNTRDGEISDVVETLKRLINLKLVKKETEIYNCANEVYANQITIDEVRRALLDIQRTKAKQILKKLGVVRLSDLPSEKYAQVIDLVTTTVDKTPESTSTAL